MHNCSLSNLLSFPEKKSGQHQRRSIETTASNHAQLNSSTDTKVTGNLESIPPDPECASAIDHYAFYLRSVSITRNKQTADKWPEIEVTEYIDNLAVISSKTIHHETFTDLEKFRRATIHGSIDDILEEKAPIHLCDLLEPNVINGREYPIKRVLIEGAPGIGKSTMSWEIFRKWGNGELFQEFSIAVMLRFRDPWVQKVESLSDLFRFPGDPEMQRDIAKQIMHTQGKGILLILDGYDEAPASLKKRDSLFFELFEGSLLPNATVIMTTRPSAGSHLHRLCKGESSRRIEVLGFGKKEIDKFIQSHFSESELKDFYQYLAVYPHIYSMMYIPLNSAIVTHVYKSCKSLSTIIPRTLTQLYSVLVRTLLLRYIKEIPEYEDIVLNDISELPQPVLEKFHQLCKLAFDGIMETKIIFSELPKEFDTLGLMQSVSELYIDKGECVSYNFLHLTIQEYLAAYHLSLYLMKTNRKLF